MKAKTDQDGRKKLKLKDDENKDELGKVKKGNMLGDMTKRGFTINDLNNLIRQYEQS